MRTTNDHGGFKEIWQSRCINKYYSGDAVPRILPPPSHITAAAALPNYSVPFPGRLIRFLGPKANPCRICKWTALEGCVGRGTLKGEKKSLSPLY